MKRQRGESVFEFIVFMACVVALIIVIFVDFDPELREGALVVDLVECTAIDPTDDEPVACTIRVMTTDLGMVTGTKHILLLREGEELPSSD